MKTKICINCQKEYNSRAEKFCSIQCTVQYNRLGHKMSQDIKNKISASKIGKKIKRKDTVIKICKFCNNNFTYTRFNYYTKTCSKHCAIALAEITRLNNIKLGITKNIRGGLAIGAGRGKQGFYQGHFCASTWELAYLIYCIDHKIDIARNTTAYSYFDPDRNGWFKYYPDFLIKSSELIEIKGYKTKLDDYKLSGVKEKPIKIMYKKELKDIFEYVKNKTGKRIEKLYELYDNIELNIHVCKQCNTIFKTNLKNRSFCSKRCTGISLGNLTKLKYKKAA